MADSVASSADEDDIREFEEARAIRAPGGESAKPRTFPGMETNHPTTPAVDALVDAMLTSCGQLAAVFHHMEQHRNTAPDAEPPAEVLARLLKGIFVPLPLQHGVDDVATAAQMLSAATELVAEDLFLVNLD
jgi:hypothetical protein